MASKVMYTTPQQIKELREAFSITVLEAIALADKGYTLEYLEEEFKDLPKQWVLELIK